MNNYLVGSRRHGDRMKERERERQRKVDVRNEGVGVGTVLYKIRVEIEYHDVPRELRLLEITVVRETPQRWYVEPVSFLSINYIDKFEVGINTDPDRFVQQDHWFKTKAEAYENRRKLAQKELDEVEVKRAGLRKVLVLIEEQKA